MAKCKQSLILLIKNNLQSCIRFVNTFKTYIFIYKYIKIFKFVFYLYTCILFVYIRMYTFCYMFLTPFFELVFYLYTYNCTLFNRHFIKLVFYLYTYFFCDKTCFHNFLSAIKSTSNFTKCNIVILLIRL